jgi:NitT/TauT family transport system substrate-binding protein
VADRDAGREVAEARRRSSRRSTRGAHRDDRYYQKLGCWTPHVEITRPVFEVALDVFQHSGLITKRHRYEDVVAPPPDAA